MENVHNKKPSYISISNLFLSLLHQSQSATSPSLILRTLLLFLLRILLSPLLLLLSPRARQSTSHGPPPLSAGPTTSPPSARALSHVLSVISRVPVSSRKYDVVISLADRLLDDNLKFSASSLNRAALGLALARTISQLQRAHVVGPVEVMGSAVRRGIERVLGKEEEEMMEEGYFGEKMAAEALWIAKRLAECGAGLEAVEMWGNAVGLARMGMMAEPRLQARLVRVSGTGLF